MTLQVIYWLYILRAYIWEVHKHGLIRDNWSGASIKFTHYKHLTVPARLLLWHYIRGVFCPPLIEKMRLSVSLYQCSICSIQQFVFCYPITHLTFIEFLAANGSPSLSLTKTQANCGQILHCGNTLETSRQTKGWTSSIRHTSEHGSRLRLPPSSSAVWQWLHNL